MAVLESSSFAQVMMLSFGVKMRFAFHVFVNLFHLAVSAVVNDRICDAAWPRIPGTGVGVGGWEAVLPSGARAPGDLPACGGLGAGLPCMRRPALHAALPTPLYQARAPAAHTPRAALTPPCRWALPRRLAGVPSGRLLCPAVRAGVPHGAALEAHISRDRGRLIPPPVVGEA